MEKTQQYKQPTSGGLQPVQSERTLYKTGVYVQFICSKITIVPRTDPAIANDNIRTDYYKIFTDVDGEELSRKTMAYVTQDKGELWEYDVNEEGEIVEGTGVKITDADEPLANWEAGMGVPIRQSVVANMLARNGF